MKRKNKKNLLELITEFAKLQLAGYIPFWGKYLGFAFFDNFTSLNQFYSLLIPTIIANILFFIVDDRWVFGRKGRKGQTVPEAIRFFIFIAFSELIVFSMTISMSTYLNLTPYLGQFVSGFFMAIWTFLGLRFWVFAKTKTPARRTTTRRTTRGHHRSVRRRTTVRQ